MSTPRASVVRGPAIIQYKGQSLYTKQDFVITPLLKLGPVASSMFGTVTHSVDDFMWQLQFVTDGQLVAGHIPVLWPYAGTYPGTSMFGAADSDVVIHTKGGQLITFKAGAVTQMPPLFFGPAETVIGACTMICVGKLASAYNATGKWMEIASSAFADTSFDKSLIRKMQYTGAWGTTPWDAFETDIGFKVAFQVSSTPDKVQGVTNDYIFDDLTATISALPVAISETQLMAAMSLDDANWQPGAAIDTLTENNDFVISGGAGKPSLTLTGCSISSSSMVFGRAKRIGEVTWQSTRTFATGALTNLFTLAWS